MGRLDDRRALVTGGGRGLGAAIARGLAAEGAGVAVLGRTAPEVEAVAAEVEAVAAEVAGAALVADVADPTSLVTVREHLAGVDIVVANAGVVAPLGRFADIDLNDWESALAVNLLGAVRVVHAALPSMLARGWGRVVTISSGAASPPGMPSANAYSTGKAALDMFTVHLAGELRGTGVTANAVRPGVVDTAMQDYMRSLPREQVGDAFHDRFHGLWERGELTAPEDSARFVIDVICSGGNGQVLDIRDRA
jgi:NAD(P)-dependent dehydrogenase (short-subunit alcohol dehydrogenase family)